VRQPATAASNYKRKKEPAFQQQPVLLRSVQNLFGTKPSVQCRAGSADDAENSGGAFGRIDAATLRVRQDWDEEKRAEKCKAQECLHSFRGPYKWIVVHFRLLGEVYSHERLSCRKQNEH